MLDTFATRQDDKIGPEVVSDPGNKMKINLWMLPQRVEVGVITDSRQNGDNYCQMAFFSGFVRSRVDAVFGFKAQAVQIG